MLFNCFQVTVETENGRHGAGNLPRWAPPWDRPPVPSSPPSGPPGARAVPPALKALEPSHLLSQGLAQASPPALEGSSPPALRSCLLVPCLVPPLGPMPARGPAMAPGAPALARAQAGLDGVCPLAP